MIGHLHVRDLQVCERAPEVFDAQVGLSERPMRIREAQVDVDGLFQQLDSLRKPPLLHE